MKGTLKSIHFESDSKGADACKQGDLYLLFCEVPSLIQNLIMTKIQISHINWGISLGMFHRIGWQFKLPRKDTIPNYLTGALLKLLHYKGLNMAAQSLAKKIETQYCY